MTSLTQAMALDPAGKAAGRYYPRIGRRNVGFVESDYDDPELASLIFGKTSKQGIKLGRRQDVLEHAPSLNDEQADPDADPAGDHQDPSDAVLRNALQVYEILANWRQRHQVRQLSVWSIPHLNLHNIHIQSTTDGL